jgi:glycosyltransferase involved in cell wall biosynthesis
MNILLTHNYREYVEVLSIFAKQIHVSDNEMRNNGVVNRPNIFPFRIPSGGILSAIRFLAQYLSEHKIDVIYAQGTRDLLLYARARRLSGCGCRIIVTSHSSYTWQIPWKPPLILALTRLFADAFIFLAHCHNVRWHAYCDRIGLTSFYLSNPVDVHRFQPKVDFQQPKSWNLGYVGVLRAQKGQSVLVETAHLLIKQGIPITVHLAGDIMSDSSRKELDELITRYHLEPVVQFYGRIEYDRVPDFLSSLDIYVCPSLIEMMPFNVLEAMASGLPIVATAVGGIPDAVRPGVEGLLAPPDNANALAECILKAMEPTFYSEFSINSRRRAESEFSYHVIARKLKSMLEQIC